MESTGRLLFLTTTLEEPTTSPPTTPRILLNGETADGSLSPRSLSSSSSTGASGLAPATWKRLRSLSDISGDAVHKRAPSSTESTPPALRSAKDLPPAPPCPLSTATAEILFGNTGRGLSVLGDKRSPMAVLLAKPSPDWDPNEVEYLLRGLSESDSMAVRRRWLLNNDPRAARLVKLKQQEEDSRFRSQQQREQQQEEKQQQQLQDTDTASSVEPSGEEHSSLDFSSDFGYGEAAAMTPSHQYRQQYGHFEHEADGLLQAQGYSSSESMAERLTRLTQHAQRTLQRVESQSLLVDAYQTAMSAAQTHPRLAFPPGQTAAEQPVTTSTDSMGELRGGCTVCGDECELYSELKDKTACGYCGCPAADHLRLEKSPVADQMYASTSDVSSGELDSDVDDFLPGELDALNPEEDFTMQRQSTRRLFATNYSPSTSLSDLNRSDLNRSDLNRSDLNRSDLNRSSSSDLNCSDLNRSDLNRSSSSDLNLSLSDLHRGASVKSVCTDDQDGSVDQPRKRSSGFRLLFDIPARVPEHNQLQVNAVQHLHDECLHLQMLRQNSVFPLVKAEDFLGVEPANKRSSGVYEQPNAIEAAWLRARRDEKREWDWNERFQAAVDLLSGVTSQMPLCQVMERYLLFTALSQDFISAAKRYGKIIISEKFLAEKTIKPAVGLGGHAGGQKYIVQGILFKFATDVHRIYGSDSSAAKAAGRELQGLIAYFNIGCRDIRLPLMALVDYLGFRLIAMILLPIDDSTIVYGSSDAGKTVHADSRLFNEKMRDAARRLNLTSHIGGVRPECCKLVHSATDIEGHYGTDRRFYLLDLARAFPPETPVKGVQAGHLFRLLRPEFVRHYARPLCPDAYSGFLVHDPNMAELNRDIDVATQALHDAVIPAAVKPLVHFILEAQEKGKLNPALVVEHLHRSGVNLRHMGRVARHVHQTSPDSNAHRIVYVEAVARVIKNAVRKMLRDKLAEQRLPVFVTFTQLLVDFLNEVLFNRSLSCWRHCIVPALVRDFGFVFPLSRVVKSAPPSDLPHSRQARRSLRAMFSKLMPFSRSRDLLALPAAGDDDSVDDEARQDVLRLMDICLLPFPSRNKSGALLLFKRLQKLTGIRFSAAAHLKFSDAAYLSSGCTALDILDVVSMEEKVKHINIVNRCQGLYYLYRSRDCSTTTSEAVQLVKRANHQFRQALAVDPTHPETLNRYAQSRARLLELTKPPDQRHFNTTDPRVIATDQYFLRSIDLCGTDSGFLTAYACFLHQCGRRERAEEYFLRALEYDPNNLKGLYEYGVFLIENDCVDDKADGEAFLRRYVEIQQSAAPNANADKPLRPSELQARLTAKKGGSGLYRPASPRPRSADRPSIAAAATTAAATDEDALANKKGRRRRIFAKLKKKAKD